MYATAYFSFYLNVFIYTMYAPRSHVYTVYIEHTINPYRKHSFTCNQGVHLCADIVHQSYEYTVYNNGCRNKISLTQSINQVGCIYYI